MRKIALLVLFSVTLSLFSLKECRADSSNFAFDAGWRKDKLHWDIAGNSNGTSPNVLSELKWDDVNSYLVKAKYTGGLGWIYLRGIGDFGWIYHGKNTDSDFAGNNRTLELSRSENKADKGSVWDVSGGIGLNWLFTLGPGTLKAAPLVGYAYDRQNLRITNGNQTVSRPLSSPPPPPVGPISGLDSKYDASWYGPWVGLDFGYELQSLSFFGTVEYHMATKYKADADWNLRTDLQHPKSFEHKADGHGWVGSLGVDFALSESWSVEAVGGIQSWRAENGTDTSFFADGTTAETRLNQVKWDSYDATFGLKYKF